MPADELGVFKVSWHVTEHGKFNLELRFNGAEIPGSQFTVHVPKKKE